MEKLIAYCGMNCAACDARIATVTHDNELRAKKAEHWKVAPEMINCTGCREAGVKIWHCENCEIKNCAISKGFQTCAGCDMTESCILLEKVVRYVPEAMENLRSLR
jgi:hypothetical protein